MAQQFYPMDLRTAKFPMLSAQQTRTVIGSQVGKSPAEYERPHLAYCHNVMPSAYGFDAVGYADVVEAPSLATGDYFVSVYEIYSATRQRVYLGWTNAGRVFALVSGATAWDEVSNSPLLSGIGITKGDVNGVSYLCYPKQAVYSYSSTSNALILSTLIGLDVTNVLGLSASSGYLIAYTEGTVVWSSTLDPLDFVPSAVTGAGGGEVADIGGDIRFCAANSVGILIYAETNVVSASYTGNVKYPFKFKEVSNSKGGQSLETVAHAANGVDQFALTKGGLQVVSSRSADIVFPEVTDFLAGQVIESYDEVTKELVVTTLPVNTKIATAIAYVGSRYVVISYGEAEGDFDFALVYDTALKRLGKLKYKHSVVFELVGAQVNISKESIGLLSQEGKLVVVDFSAFAEANGIVMLGKLQASHTRLFTLLGVEVENIPTDYPFEVYSKASLDGKTTTNVFGTPSYVANNLSEVKFKHTAKDHSLVITGAFNLVTVLVRYTINGRR